MDLLEWMDMMDRLKFGFCWMIGLRLRRVPLQFRWSDEVG
jgi:hypothetical protein